VKKTTMRRKLVLGKEIVKSLMTELGDHHLQNIRGGFPTDTKDPPGCSEPNSGCTTTHLTR
jgi:hypothetical protein